MGRPSELHEAMVKRALEFLGPGAATKHFNMELARWFYWAGEFRVGCEFYGKDDDMCEGCQLKKDNLACLPFDEREYESPDTPVNRAMAQHGKKFYLQKNMFDTKKSSLRSQRRNEIEDSMKKNGLWLNLVPDAFLIRRVLRDDDYKLFLVDIIEIDGSNPLSRKLKAYAEWGENMDYSDHAIVRLRSFSVHGILQAEYDMEKLAEIGSGVPYDKLWPERSNGE